MFTGIIEEIGTIKNIKTSTETIKLNINFGNLEMDTIKVGASVAVNGVCLTITNIDNYTFTADIMPETYKSTNLSALTVGSKVNLERAMSAMSRFDGHIVTGHIDSVVKIKKKWTVQNAIYLEFDIPNQGLIVDKGSVSLDGTSLTVFNKTKTTFQVSLIPHTQKQSILSEKSQGSIVNLENDIIGKFIISNMNNNNSYINKSFLESNGYY